MNKVILGLILAVCILGMALVMLNERLGRKNDYSQQAAPVAESGFSQDASVVPEKVDVPAVTETYKFSREATEEALSRQREQAIAALAPPVIHEALPAEEMTPEQEREALRKAAGVQLESEAANAHAGQAASLQPKKLPEPAIKAAEVPKPADVQKPAIAKPVQEKPQKPKPVVEKPVKAVPAEEPRQKPKAVEDLPKKSVPEQTEKPKNAHETAEKPEAVEAGKRASRPETAKSGGSHDVKKFVVYARENGATVRVVGAGSMAWRSMTLDNPPRVVLDLDGEWKFPANPGIPKNDIVTNVRIGKSSGNKTRVVIDLKEKPKSARVIGAKDGDGFDVRVDK